MKKKKSWIPLGILEFFVFSNIFVANAFANQLAWKLITGNVTTLVALQKIYVVFYKISSDIKNCSPLDTQNTRLARNNFMKALRTMGIQEMKFNDNMNNAERTSCGVVNNSSSRTQAAIANVGPGVNQKALGDLNVKITFVAPQAATVPDSQEAISIKFGFYAVGDTIPTEVECTMTVVLNTKSGVVVFDASKKGKLFVGYARYINTRKQLGTAATTFNGVVA